jgi:hypothetical protein
MYTTSIGTAPAVERVRISDAGMVGMGETSPTARLEVKGAGATSSTTGLLVKDSSSVARFTIRDDGGYAFSGGTVGLAQTGYSTSNVTSDRSFDANSTTLDEVADVLGTLIADLITKGIIAA